MMKLEEIGFYTLSDKRAKESSDSSPLWRCEMLVTNRCNFNCPYCRHVGPETDMSLDDALYVLDLWIADGLKNVRFSGGEPTMWPHLVRAVDHCNRSGVERIAISTNGSASREVYDSLLDAGATDFSISFDACCADDCDKMSGNRAQWESLRDTISYLSERTYVTAGVVLTEDNEDTIFDIVQTAQELGFSDIRVIPAAQHARALDVLPDGQSPILEYRRLNAQAGKSVRGLDADDSHRCMLVLDDMAVIGSHHYPCIIYAREGGKPIGKVGPDMRTERIRWMQNHDCQKDGICSGNCLDVCRDYNNTARIFNPNYPLSSKAVK
jgi:MoaA/NifB/PqqE/SkfB family radical SAM enzyme